jgi:uncharacterized protein YndB with AHSA1/START domain
MTGEDDVKPSEARTPERQMWRVTIAAPIETVWSTLVKTDAVLPFLFGAICETDGGLEPGKPMRMVSSNRKFAIAVGEVLEFNPPYRYSHTLSFTQVEGEQPARTTYELKEVAGGTELTLISQAIPSTKTSRMVKGGPFIVKNLKTLIETGRPAWSGAMVMALAPLVGLMTPKISRIENWPIISAKR